MSIVLYAHGGSENHGCEAIVRSTIELMSNEKMTLLSNDKKQEKKYFLDDKIDTKQAINPINKKSIDFYKAFFYQKIFNNYHYMDSLLYKSSISTLVNYDYGFFIGGDNYCYSDVENYRYINDYMRKKVSKLILWGASVEPKLLDNKKIRKDIEKFDFIFARESISYNALKRVNPNTYLYPDPAFYLPRKERVLPNGFEVNNTIGINLSPLVVNYEKEKGITIKNYEYLINDFLENTSYKIALIPHVVWENNDDREALKILYEKYKNTGRIILVDDCNCMEMKYLISNCCFFIGARTHSTIAAYSTSVPTLVVGYSVKARGIARDLFGTEKGYVIPVQDLKKETDLFDAFKHIVNNEKSIRKKLDKKNKEYSLLKEKYAKELISYE